MKHPSFVTSGILLGFTISLLGAGCASQATPSPATTSPQGSSTTTYSLPDVAQHKDASSCWTVVRGKVYDVTSWINQHPGGAQAIRSMCGEDATAAFTDQHNGQRRPENELATFQIGILKP